MIDQDKYAVQFLAWLSPEGAKEKKEEDDTILYAGETSKVPTHLLEEELKNVKLTQDDFGTFQQYVIIRRIPTAKD
jgi:hypothetical protein